MAVQVEVVDQIGHGAEHEQPGPDHQIKLDGMLLPFGVSRCMVRLRNHVVSCRVSHDLSSPEIEEGEDKHPDEIDEVPVETHDLDALVSSRPAGEEAFASDLEVAPQHLAGNDEQENDADRHVRAVEARDHEET